MSVGGASAPPTNIGKETMRLRLEFITLVACQLIVLARGIAWLFG